MRMIAVMSYLGTSFHPYCCLQPKYSIARSGKRLPWAARVSEKLAHDYLLRRWTDGGHTRQLDESGEEIYD